MLMIFKQWKVRKATMILLMSGYIIGILVLSVGISLTAEAQKKALMSTSGNPEHNMIVDITSKNLSLLSYNRVLPIVERLSKSVQVQLLNLKGAQIECNKQLSVSIVPVMYTKVPEWQMPLISGRHFLPSETKSKEHIALVGKQIATELLTKGIKPSSIIVNNEQYKIIGVIGSDDTTTQWDSAIYVPFQALPEGLKYNMQTSSKSTFSSASTETSQSNDSVKQKDIATLTLAITKNGKSPEEDMYLIKTLFTESVDSSEVQITSGRNSKGGHERVSNSIITTTVISSIILLVTIINVMNLSLFWVLDHKKEFAIKKALGANDSYIIKSIVLEMVLIAVLSALIAVFIQYILYIILNPKLLSIGISMSVSFTNISISALTAVICGFVTSVMPAKAIIRIEPAKTLSNN